MGGTTVSVGRLHYAPSRPHRPGSLLSLGLGEVLLLQLLLVMIYRGVLPTRGGPRSILASTLGHTHAAAACSGSMHASCGAEGLRKLRCCPRLPQGRHWPSPARPVPHCTHSGAVNHTLGGSS